MEAMVLQFILVAIGIVTHQGFLSKGEHHMHVLRYLQIFSGAFLTGIAIYIVSGDTSYQAFSKAISLSTSYLIGLYSNVIIYRFFLSPLRNFPGPILTKLSSLSLSYRLRRGDGHTHFLKLHQKYGDFVRVGSSDLSIIHPKAVEAIYGRGSLCSKAAWYDLSLPQTSMQVTRDRQIHDQRRRVWAPALDGTAVRGYEERIAPFQAQLLANIETHGGDGNRPIEVNNLFGLYNWDVMGDLAFSKSFGMLRDEKQHWAVKLLHKGIQPLGWMLPIWLFRLALSIPGATGDWFAWMDYCCQRLDERLQRKVDGPRDIMSYLLEDAWKDDKEVTKSDLRMLQGDAQLIIVAGSDTTASTLTSIFYELVRLPDGVSRLRREITDMQQAGKQVSNKNLQNLPFLNGVINETLRLYPASGVLQRKTPPEGIRIGGTFVPGDMTVFCPFYAMGRSASPISLF